MMKHSHVLSKIYVQLCQGMLQTAAATRTLRSLGHNLLHQQIYRLLVLLKPADFEAQIYPIEQTALADPSF